MQSGAAKSRPIVAGLDANAALRYDIDIPLVIDLDGTLLATDTLHESLLLFLKRRPTAAWQIPIWALSGRETLKNHLADVVTDEDVATFPARQSLVALAENEAARGRKIVLATAADSSIAEKIRNRFSFIQQVVASSAGHNLKGAAKAEALHALFPDGFIYAGDSAADLHVWNHATAAIFVGRSPVLKQQIEARTELAAFLPGVLFNFPALRRGLRLHQWAKNALIFVPLILGGKAHDASAWLHALAAFVALSLLASATYLLNDLWDLADDRQHWSKKKRPIANGELPISAALLLVALGGIAAFTIAASIGPACVAVLTLYLFAGLAYSFWLKREPIIDVLMLAALYTVRLGLGVVVTKVVFSPWLFVFSMFIFLSLSAAKRQTEITRMITHGLRETPGRGYRAEDGPLVLTIGVGAMLATVLVMVIYLIADAFPESFYKHSAFLWGFPLVIFLWLARIWLLCHRGQLNDDPVAFALKDKASLFYGAVMVVLFATALL
ncbi:MAG: UbiA family prenyltransferase [Methylovirgula sp.]|uniref:UbiA family prenyltransferase n=1 Tax=Methylovirgula sp. TaxID=1978224 RepID=UPI0030766757